MATWVQTFVKPATCTLKMGVVYPVQIVPQQSGLKKNNNNEGRCQDLLGFLEPEDVSLGRGLILLRMPASDVLQASEGRAARGQARVFSAGVRVCLSSTRYTMTVKGLRSILLCALCSRKRSGCALHRALSVSLSLQTQTE